MTVGTILSGADSSTSPYFRKKEWTGGDGKHKRNPYSCTITEFRDPQTLSYLDNDGRVIAMNANSFPYTRGLLNLPAIPDVELALANKLLNKVGAFDFNPAVSAAESREAVSMLKDAPGKIKKTSLSIFKAYVSVRKGRFKRAFRELRMANVRVKRDVSRFRFDPMIFRRAAVVKNRGGDWVTSTWLELRYGWKPLLDDIYAAASFIEQQCKSENATVKRFVCRKSANNAATRYVISSPFKYWLDRVSIQKEQLIAYVVRQNDLNEALKLAVLDPTVVAWELLPASFVVDWFISLGSWITAQAALRKLTATYIRTTTTHQFVANLRLDVKAIGTPPGIKKILKSVDRYYYEVTSVKRRVSTNFRIPLPSWHLPFKNELLHLTDSLAIFHQLRISAK